MSDDPLQAAKAAAVAATAGAMARTFLALHAGVRSWVALLIEAGVGAMLGVMVAGIAVYYDPDIYTAKPSLLIIAGAAGFAGALGTRLLDMLTAFLQKKGGV